MNLDKIIAVRNEKTVYRDGDRCLKVFGAGYSKADVLSEATNQARIEEAGINVPRVLEVTSIDRKWAIISDYIKGKTLARLAQENPEKKDEYIEALVEVQHEIQSKKCCSLRKLSDKLSDKLELADVPATVRYSMLARLAEMPHHSKICHGDLTLSNIIAADNGKYYVLDWAHAAQGNASADAAQTYFRFCIDGSFDDAEKYLELFCEKSGTEKQYVKKWMPIIATAQSVNGNARERDFLRPLINETNNQIQEENNK